MDGWIRIPRSILLDPDYLGGKFSKPAAWIDLLLLAENGTVRTSYTRLAKRWKWHVETVKRFLARLEAESFIQPFSEQPSEQKVNAQSPHRQFVIRMCEQKVNVQVNVHKNTPLASPSPSPYGFPPAPPIPYPLSTPPIIPQETDGCDSAPAYTHVHAQGPAPPGEGDPPPTPSLEEDWRHLSSVRRASIGFDRDRIAEWKRTVIAGQLSRIAPEIGMTGTEQEMFLRKWCEHNPGSDKIRAEWEDTFDVRSRAESWISWRRQNAQGDSGRTPKSRIDQYNEQIQRYNELKKQIYGTGNDSRRTSAGGLEDLPDEQ